MKDLTLALDNRPGALAEMGDALGHAGVSIEGGGAWIVDGLGIGHFLFADGTAARQALEAAGIRVTAERDVLVQRLNQAEPGQLGKLTRRMADAGVNIETLYSDHDHRMILVVDDLERGHTVSEAWERERASSPSPKAEKTKQHTYEVAVEWTGNQGSGTRTYRSYKRDYTIAVDGKPVIEGSSDPAYRGDPTRFNPEEFLVASLSSCHMLWYLHLCAMGGVCVLAYRDAACGIMDEGADGSGAFRRVELRPRVRIADPKDGVDHQAKALAIHHEAHAMCFIARSVNFPVDIAPEITTEA
jgi:organic hydroperoxide reductase OsmC/OhrA